MEFKLKNEYIELMKLLKFLNLVQSGGEAKMVISDGLVFVNEEQEFRLRRKLRIGDKVVFEDQTVTITKP